MASAVHRIVLQATSQDKKTIVAKAKRLDISISELMRRGAFSYEAADAAKVAADRAGEAIEDSLDFIAQSNQRIAAMEAKAAKATKAPARKAA
jgi:hypothetical protein